MSKWLKRWEAPTSDPADDVGSPTDKQRHKAVSVFERPLHAKGGSDAVLRLSAACKTRIVRYIENGSTKPYSLVEQTDVC